MNTTNIDWRWIALIFLILLLLSRNALTNIAVLAIGAGWAIQAGLEPWRRSGSVLGSTKVTYWRGQRIVTKQPARARLRSVSPLQVIVSFVYVALGLGSAYAALYWFARVSGL
ncbi:MAG TPA: hypothetical protein VFZ66_14725 [Herpetosiphonaceae bacterium]